MTSNSGSQARAQHAHSVQFYGADERLLPVSVGKYLAEGLQQGEDVLIIASPEHITAFLAQIQILGIDSKLAIEERRLVILDAGTALSRFMVDGRPDEKLFQNTIRMALRGLKGSSKRAYGEMVGVLWTRGQHSAAIRLEEMWNKLLPAAGLQLFCGYPIDIFGEEFRSPVVEKLLLSHTHVLPTGVDGDLERAVHHAGIRASEAPSILDSVALPQAEKAILALKDGNPDDAQIALRRARRYYETEKRFRALIENSSDAILLMNLQRQVIYASPSSFRVLGYAPEKLKGGQIFDLIHPDHLEQASASVNHALADSRRTIQFEARVRGNSAVCRWLEITVTNLSDQPEVGGFVWNCRDITERKVAERALREGERRLAARERYLQTLLDSMPECVKVLDGNGSVLEMNLAGLRMLEADDAQQVVGKSVYPLVDESDRAAFQALNDYVFNGGDGGSLEFSVTGLKGAHRTFETNVVPLRDEADRVVGALSATRDVTEHKAAEAALLRANESLEQFAYAAAHDLQEPIRNVALYTELLAERYRGKLDEKADEIISVTVEGARRMQALVDDLLAYTRSLDKPHDQPPKTNANEVVVEVLSNLRTAIDNAGAEIVCGELPSLPIHRAHLVQLLQNLVGNALKYRSELAPRIEIRTVARGDEFVTSVRDNGIGIPPDQQDRIFGVFKRLHGRAVPGNGIGLAICHRIISHYAGRIWVESQPGQGSTFAFTLPRYGK